MKRASFVAFFIHRYFLTVNEEITGKPKFFSPQKLQLKKKQKQNHKSDSFFLHSVFVGWNFCVQDTLLFNLKLPKIIVKDNSKRKQNGPK